MIARSRQSTCRLDIVPIWNDTFGLAYASYLAALLRRVVFVGEPALRRPQWCALHRFLVHYAPQPSLA